MSAWELLRPILTLGAPAGVLAALLVRVDRQRWTRAWRRVAGTHGMILAQDPFGPAAAAQLLGEVRGRPCRVKVQSDAASPVVARVEVPLTVRAPLGLELTREGTRTWLEERLGASELELGDAAFDRRHHVRSSDVTLARHVLDAPTRRALLRADLDRVQVERGVLVGQLRGRTLGGATGLARRVERAIPALAGLAWRLELQPQRERLVPPLATAYPSSARAARWLERGALVFGLAGVALAGWPLVMRAVEAAQLIAGR